MSTLNIQLPDSLHRQLRDCAERENTSIDQLITLAVSEILHALRAADYLEMRAARGDRAKFAAVLAGVADVEPEPFDRLSGTRSQPSTSSPAKRKPRSKR